MIAMTVFPILRVLFADLFEAAVRSINQSQDSDCDISLRAQFLGAPEKPGIEALTAPDSNVGEWHAEVLKLDRTDPPSGVMLAMLDTAVDVTHGALSNAGIDKNFINPDHAVPSGDPFAMGSFGAGHGTAMAGIMVANGVGYPFKGVAPHAKLSTARISTLLSDSDGNRLDLAGTVFDSVYHKFETPARALLVAPPIAEPAADAFIVGRDAPSADTPNADAEKISEFLKKHGIAESLSGEALLAELRTEAIDRDDALCDTFILSLMLISELIPVVLPAGNDGSAKLAHPANPVAYQRIGALIADNPTAQIMAVRQIERVLLGDMTPTRERILDILLNSGGAAPVNVAEAGMLSTKEFTIVSDWISRIATQFKNIDLTADAFEGTGIIVVGAGTVDLEEVTASGSDAITLATTDGTALADVTLRPARYSQSGPGLCLLAPSDDEPLPRKACASMDAQRPRGIGTTDVVGYAGFADDPSASFSHGLQPGGFGGTSAASAQVTALLAYLPAETSGPEAREALILAAQGVADSSALSWDPERGYGQATFEGLTA